MAEITEILARARNGDGGALSRLMPLVCKRLRGLDHRALARASAAHRLVNGGGAARCRRAPETQFNLVLEARP